MMIYSFHKITHVYSPKGLHSVCDDVVTLKAVEEVYSNCRLKKMRLKISHFSLVSSHLLPLVVL